MRVKCSFKSVKSTSALSCQQIANRVHISLIHRFHWLEPMAQVADSVFEWFFFSLDQIEWVQWFMLIDMMNDKRLCIGIIKIGASKMNTTMREKEKKEENNNLRLLTMKHDTVTKWHVRACTEESSKWNGALFHSLHSAAIYVNGIQKRQFWTYFSATRNSSSQQRIKQQQQQQKSIFVIYLRFENAIRNDSSILFADTNAVIRITQTQTLYYGWPNVNEMSIRALHLSQIWFSC